MPMVTSGMQVLPEGLLKHEKNARAFFDCDQLRELGGEDRRGGLFGERVMAGANAWRLLPSASTAEAPRLADAGRAGLGSSGSRKGESCMSGHGEKRNAS